MRIGRHFLSGVVALASLTCLACNLTDYSGLVYHVVAPADCDPELPAGDARHLCGFNGAGTTFDRLVVFLPGTAGAPGGHQLLLKELALQYPVIGLSYPNAQSLGALCGDDLAAYGPARAEICTGDNQSALVEVLPNESIAGRLSSLLVWLSAWHPGEGWQSFLTDDGLPDWSKVILCGYSQGAGHAAWLAQAHQVAGVILFSGVVDASITGSTRISASWITQAMQAGGSGSFGATPLSRFRFFLHSADGFLPGIQANLATMGLAWSARDDVDDGRFDPADSPILSTSRFFLDSNKAHPATCEDGATPQALDGSAVFAPVWAALLASSR